MNNNQFAIQPVSHKQKVQELTALNFLNATTTNLTGTQLWHSFLKQISLANPTSAGWQQFCNNILIDNHQTLHDFFEQRLLLTDSIFHLVSLQLLEFEVDVDFSPTAPLAAWQKINLPTFKVDEQRPGSIIDAWYQLLCTHTKNGQNYIDALTSRGFLAANHHSHPLFFNGKALAVFNPTKLIREVVYVETDLDTDHDHQADLIKVEIMRPGETNQGLLVPAVYTASPYNQGTNDEWGQKLTHQVQVKLHHKTSVQQTDIPPFNKSFNRQPVNGEQRFSDGTFTQQSSYTLNNYLAVRGFAIIYSAGIGTKDSDGLQTCGSPEQTEAMVAVIEWLTGKRRAFTNQIDGIEIKAWWCNGNVAMTGRSYLGTLATAAATTGVTGLKTIISEAAISNWYDYYRENGLVMAPGGFPGEDADVLAAETFSRAKNAGDFAKIKNHFNGYLTQMNQAMDRQSGNYNDFWRQRNYRPNIKNIKADIMMVHGLNDWNVKLNQVKNLWDGLKDLPINQKIVLHQGQHIYINAFRSLDFTDMVNLWLTNKLWEIDNHANEVIPNVIVQDNTTPETWHAYESWEDDTKPATQWSLQAGTLSTTSQATETTLSFTDHLDDQQFNQFCEHPATWQKKLVSNKNPFSLRFTTTPTVNDLLLRGTPSLTLRVASSKNYGMVSAQLVDYGVAKRLNQTPTILSKNGLELGYLWEHDDLREFQLASQSSDYHVISFGHLNLQNRQRPDQVDDLTADQFVEFKLNLQPVFHQLVTGHQLGLILFSTDFGMTVRGNDDLVYQVALDQCQLVIPTVDQIWNGNLTLSNSPFATMAAINPLIKPGIKNGIRPPANAADHEIWLKNLIQIVPITSCASAPTRLPMIR